MSETYAEPPIYRQTMADLVISPRSVINEINFDVTRKLEMNPVAAAIIRGNERLKGILVDMAPPPITLNMWLPGKANV